MSTPRHRGEYPGALVEWATGLGRTMARALERSGGGMKPRLHACANAPKHAHLWTRGIERSLPRHRAPQHVDPVAYAALLATPRGGRF